MDLSTCLSNSTPMVLPYASHQLTYALGSASFKGIAFEVGTPPQAFSTEVSAVWGNSILAAVQVCSNNVTNYTCIADYGGVYVPDSSTTKKKWTSTNNWLNSSDTIDVGNTEGLPALYYNDIWQINKHSIADMPFLSYLDPTTYTSLRSTLSLGKNSSTLNMFASANLIPAKFWSFWPGIRSLAGQAPGHLVIGGYDQDRIKGDFTKIKINSSSPTQPLQTEITGITWDTASNSTSLMPDSAHSLVGIIELDWYSLGLPYAALRKFITATGALYTEDIGPYYLNGQPQGSLVITLSTGTKVNILADDLFTLGQDWDDKGVLSRVGNDTTYYAWVEESTSKRFLNKVVLGMPFLEQLVLGIDFDKDAFYLAEAQKTDYGNPTHLKTMCQPTVEPTITPNGTVPIETSKTKINSAAIGGGVGGGLAAILVGVLAFCLHRRRKSKKQISEISEPGEMLQKPHDRSSYHSGTTSSPPPVYPIFEVDSPHSPQTQAQQSYDRSAMTSPVHTSDGGQGPAPQDRYMAYPGKHEVQVSTSTYEMGSNR